MSSDSLSERQNMLQRIIGLEKLRKGTIELIRYLQHERHQIFVYTTSYRSTAYIRLMFASYGIWLDSIINQNKHDRIFKGSEKKYTKYPPAFGIDLHIDDSEGVAIEGERGSFKVLWIDASKELWVDDVLSAVDKMNNENKR